jgi:hypothetical protein
VLLPPDAPPLPELLAGPLVPDSVVVPGPEVVPVADAPVPLAPEPMLPEPIEPAPMEPVLPLEPMLPVPVVLDPIVPVPGVLAVPLRVVEVDVSVPDVRIVDWQPASAATTATPAMRAGRMKYC